MLLDILSREFPLTGKQVLLRLNRYHGKGVSYQAVHKLLKKMVLGGVLTKESFKYRISLRYVEQMTSFLERVKQDYENRGVEIVEESCRQIDSFLENGEEPVGETIAKLVKEAKQRDIVLGEVHRMLQKMDGKQPRFSAQNLVKVQSRIYTS